ncbi:unnamed protein product [Caenorhabditis brenneri]
MPAMQWVPVTISKYLASYPVMVFLSSMMYVESSPRKSFNVSLQGNFEIAILITHNCNTNVKPYRHFEIYLGSFAIKDFHFIENIGRIELFNKGEQTKDVIGKNRPSRRFKRA